MNAFFLSTHFRITSDLCQTWGRGRGLKLEVEFLVDFIRLV